MPSFRYLGHKQEHGRTSTSLLGNSFLSVGLWRSGHSVSDVGLLRQSQEINKGRCSGNFVWTLISFISEGKSAEPFR